jgi:hypothetical protein
MGCIIIKYREEIKMANRVNRYKTMYERMIRSDNGSVFPRNVFVRAANLHASLYDRVGDR